MLDFSGTVVVPDTVLFRDLCGEAILLDLDTELYFGLDDVGTRMWSALTSEASIRAAYEILLAEYDVDPDRLRRDMEQLIDQLLERHLIELEGG